MTTIKLTRPQWHAQGVALFGEDQMRWRFICPACNHVASVQDYKDAGAPSTAAGVACVGRFMPHRREAFAAGTGPCDYSGKGLICISPVQVDDLPVFGFAPKKPQP